MKHLLTSIIALACVWLPSTAHTITSAVANIIWLGAPTEEHLAHWKQQGFSTERVSCTTNVGECLKNALVDNKGANYLFVDRLYTNQLLDLYRTDMLGDVSGIILFGATEPEPRIRTKGRRPKLLVVAEQSADADLIYQSRRTATRLRNRGVPATFMFVPDGELHSPDMGLMAQDIILHFFGLRPAQPDFASLLDAYVAWHSPPFDNSPLRSHFDLLNSYRVTAEVEYLFEYFFRNQPHQLKQWKFDNYLAFDLLKYRDRVLPGARYLTLANRRGQQYFIDLEQFAQYEPVIIVGVDDEPNMYRFVWFYRTKKMYSWKDDVQNISARTLGPMLHFRRPVPEELTVPLLLRSALSLDGISYSHADPLAEIADYSEAIQRVITNENKCVYCHPLSTTTPRAYHLDAITAQPQGGYALPLNEYPDHVMKAFLYDQENSSKAIGMTPNFLKEDVVDEFYEWVKTQ